MSYQDGVKHKGIALLYRASDQKEMFAKVNFLQLKCIPDIGSKMGYGWLAYLLVTPVVFKAGKPYLYSLTRK